MIDNRKPYNYLHMAEHLFGYICEKRRLNEYNYKRVSIMFWLRDESYFPTQTINVFILPNVIFYTISNKKIEFNIVA